MNSTTNLLGCFVSGPSVMSSDNQETKDKAAEQGALFRKYIWGEDGISKVLKLLNHSDYGSDLVVILFQFYLNPIAYELKSLKEIDSYRKKEKSIAVAVIVNDDNFFSKPEADRRQFLRNAIFEKLRLLERHAQKKGLDTNFEKLTNDLGGVYT